MAFTPEPYVRRAYYYETDVMGIVHHSNYIRWMEEARLDFFHQAGLKYSDMEKDGILMPVVEVYCKYKSSIRFDEEFEIRTRLVLFSGVRAEYEYETNSLKSGVLAAVGRSSHCFVDSKTRRPLNLKKRYPDFYKTALSLQSGQ